MKFPSHARRRRAQLRSTLLVLVACVFATALAACGSTTSGSSSGTSTSNASATSTTGSSSLITPASADQTALAATIKNALLAPVPVSQLAPVVANTFAVASKPLTSAQDALLRQCLHENSCDTGHGTLTLGINADFANNPFWNIRRAEATAQAIAMPQIKRIIYTSAPAGDISQVLANLRSLVAQKVDIIVEDPVFGAAILPAARQAVQSGIAFVTANSPLPDSAASSITTQLPYDLCGVGTTAAKVISQALGSNKSYALYTGVPGNSDAAEWQPCLEKVLNGVGWTKAVTGFTQWTAQGTVEAANALVASGKKVDALFHDDFVDDFLKAYISAHQTPPVTFSDTPHFSSFGVLGDAAKAGLKGVSYVANGHVWYVRMAVTAGVMAKLGMSMPKKILAPVPVVPMSSIQYLDLPGMPANSPLPTLLTPADAQVAISIG